LTSVYFSLETHFRKLASVSYKFGFGRGRLDNYVLGASERFGGQFLHLRTSEIPLKLKVQILFITWSIERKGRREGGG
jgi:hypothetical protein